MAEFNFDELMQRLRGDPKPTDPGVGFTGQGTRELGVSDIIFPQAAPAEGEVEQELVGGPDVGFTGQDTVRSSSIPKSYSSCYSSNPWASASLLVARHWKQKLLCVGWILRDRRPSS